MLVMSMVSPHLIQFFRYYVQLLGRRYWCDYTWESNWRKEILTRPVHESLQLIGYIRIATFNISVKAKLSFYWSVANFWLGRNMFIEGKDYSPMHEPGDIDTSKKNTPDNHGEDHIDIIIWVVQYWFSSFPIFLQHNDNWRIVEKCDK